jgi:hypothetical protein
MNTYKEIIEDIADKFQLIKEHRHLFEFDIKNNDNICVANICPCVYNGKVEMEINVKIMDCIPIDERDYILAHELAHLEQFFVNHNDIGFSSFLHENTLQSSWGIVRLILAPLLIVAKPNLMLLSLGIGLQAFNTVSINFHLKKRNLEYDADERAIKILKTNTGAVKFLTRDLYKGYINFLKSGDWMTHPSNKSRLLRVS